MPFAYAEDARDDPEQKQLAPKPKIVLPFKAHERARENGHDKYAALRARVKTGEFYEQVRKGFTSVMERTTLLMEQKPACKRNKPLLVFLYHYYFDGWNEFIKPEQLYHAYKKICQSTSPDGVTRAQRKLYEFGVFEKGDYGELEDLLTEEAFREVVKDTTLADRFGV